MRNSYEFKSQSKRTKAGYQNFEKGTCKDKIMN